MVWTNSPKQVFHGTIDLHVSAIKAGINPATGRGAADFGRGFYVTTDLHQAQQWANKKSRGVPRSTPRAAVLTFNLDREAIASFGDHLAFVVADTDFYGFVQFNRFGSSKHGRASFPYDVVYGPVAAYPQTLSFAGCDQICFVAGGRNVMKALKALTFTGASFGTPFF